MPLKPKESMTAFDTATIVSWVRRNLKGSRLSNIYLIQEAYVLRFKGAVGDVRIVAEPGKRMHPSSFDVAEKGMPPPQVMAMRKRVRGAVLVDAEQLGFDRIVRLRFSSGYDIVVEMVPRGVLALLAPDGRIVVATEYREMRDRVIKPGHSYTPPPSATVHPRDLTARELLERIQGSGRREAARALVVGLGYPGEVVEEVLLRVGLKPSSSLDEVKAEAERLVEEFKRVYREVEVSDKGFLLLAEGKPVTVVTFRPRALVDEYGLDVREEPLPEAFDTYYIEVIRKRLAEEEASKLEVEKAKLERSIREAEERIRELMEKKVRLERLAEAVSVNISTIYKALECVDEVRRRAGWDYVIGNCPGVVDVNPGQGVVRIAVGDTTIDLKVNVDPQRYVVDLYRRIGELESKIGRAKRALEDLKKRLEALKARTKHVEAEAAARVRRRKWYERFHWMITSNGFLVLAGRDASQNETLVRKYLDDNDVFLHADIHGAAAVVLKTGGREPHEEDLREAAVIAAAYSKAWKAGLAAIDVFWVKGSQVSKSPPSGEYLAKGAFMVYGRKNFIKGIELRLAIGVGVDENESPIVIVGPLDLVKRRSIVYAVLVPGRMDPSSLASKLKREFAKRVPQQLKPLIDAVSVEELRQRIPGPSEAIEVGIGDVSRRRGAEEGSQSD